MAIGAKMAGILSGLGIGITFGVVLAALNPILPRTDQTDVAQVADVSTPQPDTTSPLAGVQVEDSAPETQAAPDAQLPNRAETAPTAPERPQNNSVGSVATRVGDLGDGGASTSELALVMPKSDGSAPTDRTTGQGLQAGAPEAAPDVDTQTAAPLDVPKPDAQTDAPIAPTVAEQSAGALQSAGVSDTSPVVKGAPSTPAALAEDGDALASVDTQSALAPAPKLSGTADIPQVETASGTAPASGNSLNVVSVEGATNPAVKSLAKTPRTVGTLRTQGDDGLSRFPQVGASDSGAQVARLGSSISARLPKIDDTAETEIVNAPEETPAKGALDANRLSFTIPDKPLVSVVLIDDGSDLSAITDLRDIGLPIAISVPVDAPDATARARAFRNAGFEVLAMATSDVRLSLPGNQAADQVAQTLDSIFSVMPDAIGLIDRPAATIQRDRTLSRYIVEHFSETGHGFVTYRGGLNSVPRLAAQQSVAAGSIYRILTKNDVSTDTLQQVMNRAALEARSKGQVIVMSTPDRDTLSALVNWSRGGRGTAIAFAPVSASLAKPLSPEG